MTSTPSFVRTPRAAISALDRASAERLVREVTAFFDQSVESYVQERHRTLKQTGLKNDEIYALVSCELKHHRFRAPELSARQLRRLIYG